MVSDDDIKMILYKIGLLDKYNISISISNFMVLLLLDTQMMTKWRRKSKLKLKTMIMMVIMIVSMMVTKIV